MAASILAFIQYIYATSGYSKAGTGCGRTLRLYRHHNYLFSSNLPTFSLNSIIEIYITIIGTESKQMESIAKTCEHHKDSLLALTIVAVTCWMDFLACYDF